MKTATDQIQEKLDRIETEHDVRILYAIESGSRAWGFASPDSDYDVRFIYVRKQDEYLRLDQTDDVIEYELNEVLDIVGWDITKALQLFHKSNPSLFEWLGSPIVYRTTDAFERLRPLLEEHYQQKFGLYHYRSMAKKNFLANFKDDQIRLKKYLYVIRPILACKWIMKNGTPPPVLFRDLLENVLEPTLMSAMENLLEKKSKTEEGETQPRIAIWDKWIQENLAQLENIAELADLNNVMPWARLNAAFLEILSNAN